MIPPVHYLAFALALTAAGATFAADAVPVLSPTARHSKLGAAKRILSPTEAPLPANLVDPFNPTAFAGAAANAGGSPATGAPAGPAAADAPRSDLAVLQAIAAGLKPSGFFVIAGESTLVFGQKKVKAGSYLTLTFEGKAYTLQITAINLPTFTLRLNREEYTRPIK